MDVLYLALHQHGDVYKHVVQLLDAALQTDDVFVSGFDLAQGLFRDPRVHNLSRGEVYSYHQQLISLHEDMSPGSFLISCLLFSCQCGRIGHELV